MTDSIKFLLAITCAIPTVAGLLIIRTINKQYQPIVYILLLTSVTELVQRCCIVFKYGGGINNLISNIFIPLNLLMHLWLFYQVDIIIRKKTAVIYFSVFFIVYLCNAIYVASFFAVYEIAIIASYIIILKLCIDGMVMQTFSHTYKWSADGLFLFCTINTLYSAYLIFAFSLRFFGVPTDTEINMAVASMYYYINAGCYILTLWAILCIPKRNYIELSFWHPFS